MPTLFSTTNSRRDWTAFHWTFFEYENNLNAADHPLDAKGNPTNLGKQSHGYLADFSLGGVKNRNDVQFGYAFEREEQDAIISSFAERRAASSNQHHRTQSLWAMESAFECNGSVYVLAGKNAEQQFAAFDCSARDYTGYGWTVAQTPPVWHDLQLLKHYR